MTDDEFRSWRDGLADEDATALLHRTLASTVAQEIELPHIVICLDPESGARSYSGPYPDGLTALRAAQRDADRDRLCGFPDQMEYGVAALLDAEEVPSV